MKVVVVGTPNEIASLTLELQGMQSETLASALKRENPDIFIPSDSSSECSRTNRKCSC